MYSTWTLTPLENQQVCDYLLSEFGDYIAPESLNDLFEGAAKPTQVKAFLLLNSKSTQVTITQIKQLKKVHSHLTSLIKAKCRVYAIA